MERRADRTKYARHAKTLGSCGAALVFALVVLGDGCGPDYSRSHGSDGTLPPKMPAVPDTLTEWVMTPPESSLAKCSTPFQFSVRVEQAVPNCEAADFRLLYERALALAQSRIAHYTCPKGCGPAYAWILSQSWDCDVPVGETRTRAAANVGYGVTCPAAPEDKDSGLLPSPATAPTSPCSRPRCSSPPPPRPARQSTPACEPHGIGAAAPSSTCGSPARSSACRKRRRARRSLCRGEDNPVATGGVSCGRRPSGNTELWR